MSHLPLPVIIVVLGFEIGLVVFKKFLLPANNAFKYLYVFVKWTFYLMSLYISVNGYLLLLSFGINLKSILLFVLSLGIIFGIIAFFLSYFWQLSNRQRILYSVLITLLSPGFLVSEINYLTMFAGNYFFYW